MLVTEKASRVYTTERSAKAVMTSMVKRADAEYSVVVDGRGSWYVAETYDKDAREARLRAEGWI